MDRLFEKESNVETKPSNNRLRESLCKLLERSN